MKIARKFGKIVVRLSKIGHKTAKIVYPYIFVCTFQLRRLYLNCQRLRYVCRRLAANWSRLYHMYLYMLIFVTKIVLKLSTIACQLRKIGHGLAKIVFLYEHL